MLAALLVLLTLPILVYREPPPVHARQAQTVPYVQVFTSFFSRPGLRGWLVVLATYKVGESLGSAMVKPMLVDMGLDLRQIGLLVSVVGSLAALAGALLGGALTTRLGRRSALLGFGALQAVSRTVQALEARARNVRKHAEDKDRLAHLQGHRDGGPDRLPQQPQIHWSLGLVK